MRTPVTVAYAVPEPAVTYKHRRDAGPVSISYTVPPAEITYARGPRSFAVDADPVSVEYFVHIALVTHVSVAAPPIVKWLRLVGLPWSQYPTPLEDRRGAGQSNAASRHGRRATRCAEWWPLDRAPGWTCDVGQNSTAPTAYRRDWNGVPRAHRPTESGSRWEHRAGCVTRWSGITGDDPPRVIELPREGFAFGRSSLPWPGSASVRR